MVFFNCNACGESIKKSAVEKHYQLKCKNCTVLSCVDCSKEFWGDDYKSHNQCISESEKYGGKDYKPKPGVSKAEQKAEKWKMQIYSAMSKCENAKLKQTLEKILEYPNIPTKKVKFENFMKNMLLSYMANAAWNAIIAEASKPDSETESKDTSTVTSAAPTSGKASQIKPAADNDMTSATSEPATESETKKLSKRDRKEERRKLKHKSEKKEKQKSTAATNNDSVEENNDRQKKKKKRKRGADEMDEDDKNEAQNGEGEAPVKKSKKSKRNANESVLTTQNGNLNGNLNESLVEETSKTAADTKAANTEHKFNWEKVIFSVLKKQEDRKLAVKKLRKKVIAEFIARAGDAYYDESKLLTKFNKKLTKNPKLRVLKDKVELLC